MGFYGNITDTSRTHFQFDKIFNNRTEMDSSLVLGTDNVFAGRFVLVKYDANGTEFQGDFIYGYKSASSTDLHLYADMTCEHPYIFTTFTKVANPSVENCANYYYKSGRFYFKLPDASYYLAEHEDSYYEPDIVADNIVCLNKILQLKKPNGELTGTFYRCTGATAGEMAEWEQIISDEDYPHYFTNYQIDAATYGDNFDNRGYDATVWQKVYSEGQGKFIPIARFNCTAPGFELVPDAPTENPSAPYLDGTGTDSFYRIHVPTRWGFQIKEGQREIDENQNITYPYSDQVINRGNSVIYGDIYLNLGGANQTTQQNYHRTAQHKDLTMPNTINITPTGESGAHYANGQTVDMMELGIHLPAVGNMIDDGYDLIYGANQDHSRPMDVEWYSGDSPAQLKQEGNVLAGGKTYDLTTIAGNINTIHNVLGQIVVDLTSWPTAEQVESLSSDYIYRYNDNYYRKGMISDPTLVQESEYTYTQQTGITAQNFKRNKYYYKSGNNYLEAEAFNSTIAANDGYYLKNINSVRYTPISLISFVGSFYYKDGENYYKDSGLYPTYSDRTYYTNIQNDGGHTFQAQYVADGTYYTEEDGNYSPSYSTTPTLGTTYYSVSPTAQNNGNAIRYYHPNCYYAKAANSTEWHLSDGVEYPYDPLNYTYAVFTFSNEPRYGVDPQGNIIQYYEVVSQTILQTLQLPPAGVDLYILKDGTYISYDNIGDLGVINGVNAYACAWEYYTLNVTSYQQSDLYLPNVYYSITPEGHYIKDSDALQTGHLYYLITNVDTVTDKFYLPDTYWYEVGQDEFEQDSRDTMANNTQYYTKLSLYVYSDDTKQCPFGYEWSDYAPYVPPSVVLCYLDSIPAMIQLNELDRNTDSLYGLLLRLSTLYGAGDELSRDTSTSRGAYNYLRDVLYQMKNLRCGRILYVNDFGQIESSNITITDLQNLINNS